MSPITVVLAISLTANAVLGYAYLGQRDTAVATGVREGAAVATAQQCSDGTDQLAQQAAQRDKDAGPARQAAADKNRGHQVRAQELMKSAGAVPGDACASAEKVVDGWWAQRVKAKP